MISTLIQAIETKEIHPSSPMEVIAKAMALTSMDKESLIELLNHLIRHTHLLPQNTINDIQTILTTNKIDSICQTILDISKGNWERIHPTQKCELNE